MRLSSAQYFVNRIVAYGVSESILQLFCAELWTPQQRVAMLSEHLCRRVDRLINEHARQLVCVDELTARLYAQVRSDVLKKSYQSW